MNKKNNNEKERYITLGVDIPFELKDKLKFLSYKKGIAIKKIVKDALELYIEKNDKSFN